MGIINKNCCYKMNNNLHNEIIVAEDASGNQITGIVILKEIQPINDISNCFDFIISGEFYLLLFKISSPQSIIEKLVYKLKNVDILILIDNSVRWIKIQHSVENKIIKETKINLEYGTKRILFEINSLSEKKNILQKDLEIKCLSDLSLIIQYIKYINFHNKDINYENNFWKGISIEKEIKYLTYKISYNLMNIKKKMLKKETDIKEYGLNMKKKISSKHESIKLFNYIEKFINEVNSKYLV